MNDEEELCKDCRYWRRQSGSTLAYGDCRRYPPEQESERFPRTHNGNWCGEWRSHEDYQKRII